MTTIKDLKLGQKLKVVKDIYYVSDGNVLDNEFLTKEEVFNNLAHVCVMNDIYEVVDEGDYGVFLNCIEGTWKGESSDGWFNDDDMLSKGVFELID
jgi:hypothetical protein